MEGKKLQELPTPCLVVSKKAVENNCQKMLDKAAEMGVQLRGQTKTHKTLESGVLQTGGSKRCIVVSTLNEAEMYAKNGFDDILYGYPLQSHHMSRNFELARNLEAYHLMINSKQSAEVLLSHDPPSGKKWSVYLKIDVGYHRAGIPCGNKEEILSIAKLLLTQKPGRIELQGLYAHCGNSYSGTTHDQVKNARDESILKLDEVAQLLKNHGISIRHQGIGSTPSCSQDVSKDASFDALTEIHPGNYVFYDLQQLQLGSCQMEDIAARVLTRIIGHFPGERNQMIIDAGFTALSQQGFKELNGSYAQIKDCPELKVVKMTQEIGFVDHVNGEPIDFDKYPIGSVFELLQYHSCDTAARYGVYYVHDEHDKVIELWHPTRCW